MKPGSVPASQPFSPLEQSTLFLDTVSRTMDSPSIAVRPLFVIYRNNFFGGANLDSRSSTATLYNPSHRCIIFVIGRHTHTPLVFCCAGLRTPILAVFLTTPNSFSTTSYNTNSCCNTFNILLSSIACASFHCKFLFGASASSTISLSRFQFGFRFCGRRRL